MNKLNVFLSALLATSSLASTSNAQGVTDEIYGRGVHAYFAGQNDKAIEWFDEAIAAGSQDPRVHYFRGLANVRASGGTFEAGIVDFEQAAKLEITSGRVVDIGKALQRIQGETRRQIEDIRLQVRLSNKDNLPRVPITPTVPNVDAANNPFKDDQGLIGGEPKEMVAPAVVDVPPATDDSSFDSAPESTAPAPTEPSPFGDDAAPAGDANPFDSGSSDNPFGS